jgi:aspartyl-tRNA(Asn)/glutamyl-tRNA(Gln) amidotransferase subunit A
MAPLYELSVAEAGRLLRAGELAATELAEHALARIDALDPHVHAFVYVTRERALEDAERADDELRAGVDRGPMHGIPYALKDIFATAGIPTTCHSKLFLDHVPERDSAVEARLRAGGAVLVGKLATHELALGGPSFDLPFPPARNPWDLERFTGASSSGSAAAVAAGMVRVALGTDTSGSIRGPACHCGVVGLKPTYGLVSTRGVFPLSYSLDHCGPLARSVEDAALATAVVAGYDPADPSSVDRPLPDLTAELGRDLRGMRMGYPRSFWADADGVSAETTASIDAAAETLAELGAAVEEVELPAFELFNACGRIIMTAEAYAIHEDDLRTRPLDFGRYTYQRLIPGAAISAADLVQAHRLRRELALRLNRDVLDRYDALVAATVLAPAARLSDFPLDWPAPPALVGTRTLPFNVTGNPALALPTGFTEDGLPVGMQVVGRAFEEAAILRIGAAYEAATPWRNRRPDLDDIGFAAPTEERPHVV